MTKKHHLRQTDAFDKCAQNPIAEEEQRAKEDGRGMTTVEKRKRAEEGEERRTTNIEELQ